jgi:hypothetical protein
MRERYSLEQLRIECARELARPVERAESLEELGDRLHRLAARVDWAQPPANDLSELAAQPAFTTFDRIAIVLGLTVYEVDFLDPSKLALFIDEQRLILVQRGLRSIVRTLWLGHELSHSAAGRGAEHAEVWYLTLALLVPRLKVHELAPGEPIGTANLVRRCPWPVPLWVGEMRAMLLRRWFQ